MSCDALLILDNLEKEDEEGKGYCALSVDADSASLLYNLICENSDKLSPECRVVEPHSMHCTLMYDKRDEDEIPIASKPEKLIYDAEVIGTGFLGEPGSKWGAGVLKLHCPDLMKRFKKLKEEGFKHSFDDLIIHVSLVYGANESDGELVKELFDKGMFPKTIQLCNEYWEEIKDD